LTSHFRRAENWAACLIGARYSANQPLSVAAARGVIGFWFSQTCFLGSDEKVPLTSRRYPSKSSTVTLGQKDT
jgi:hypothetical protein